MPGLELLISGVGSNHSTNWTTTTALNLAHCNFYYSNELERAPNIFLMQINSIFQRLSKCKQWWHFKVFAQKSFSIFFQTKTRTGLRPRMMRTFRRLKDAASTLIDQKWSWDGLQSGKRPSPLYACVAKCSKVWWIAGSIKIFGKPFYQILNSRSGQFYLSIINFREKNLTKAQPLKKIWKNSPIKRYLLGGPPLLSGFVCTFHPAPPGLSP